jgi:hypothetical protein
LFDLDERYAALSKRGDPLERLAAVEDFEMYRAGAGEHAEEAIVSKEARVDRKIDCVTRVKTALRPCPTASGAPR